MESPQTSQRIQSLASVPSGLRLACSALRASRRIVRRNSHRIILTPHTSHLTPRDSFVIKRRGRNGGGGAADLSHGPRLRLGPLGRSVEIIQRHIHHLRQL